MSTNEPIREGDTVWDNGEKRRIVRVDQGTAGWVTDDRGRSYSPIGLQPDRGQHNTKG